MDPRGFAGPQRGRKRRYEDDQYSGRQSPGRVDHARRNSSPSNHTPWNHKFPPPYQQQQQQRSYRTPSPRQPLLYSPQGGGRFNNPSWNPDEVSQKCRELREAIHKKNQHVSADAVCWAVLKECKVNDWMQLGVGHMRSLPAMAALFDLERYTVP